uniref:Transmembrane protein 186 n=1 Tax=Syphacia muris TaxID=451379 RepID=A0A0N5AII7_9BILA
MNGIATPHETLARRVFITKILSLSSSGAGLAMLPVITHYLWDNAVDCPAVMAVIVANAILTLMSLTPFLLQFLVKRFILNIYYNSETKMFTTVHYGFWTNKKALRFSANDVVDASVAPEFSKLWLPLATVFVHGRPLLLSLNIDAYKDKEAFLNLTKNVKIPANAD